MAKPNYRKPSTPERGQRAIAFLSDSAIDYLGARVLLLSKLPQQGAVLASTAIEKACKAMLAFQGQESHGHLKKAHWNAVRAFNSDLFSKLDADFMALNQRAYRLRYTDDLPAGFNLVIATREFLAALDVTLIQMHQLFYLAGEGAPRTRLQGLIANRDHRLLTENHVLSGIEKSKFVENTPQFVYEARFRRPEGRLFEMHYWAIGPALCPGFLREGCRVVDQAKQIFAMSHNVYHAPKAKRKD